MTAMPGYNNLTYDIDNRLLSASGNGSWEQYAYLADNKRVWKQTNLHSNPVEQYYLYGVGGERIATYTVNQQMLNEGTLHLSSNQNTIDVYFGGRLIWQNGQAVLRDRLGSVMARRVSHSTALERHDYFPYGEERTPSIGDRNKFGTYHRDQTGLDYADQRYYNSAIGRFLSADPYEDSGGASEPASWGRGVYVHGDPVNFNDRPGLAACPAGSENNCIEVIDSYPTLPPGSGGGTPNDKAQPVPEDREGGESPYALPADQKIGGDISGGPPENWRRHQRRPSRNCLRQRGKCGLANCVTNNVSGLPKEVWAFYPTCNRSR